MPTLRHINNTKEIDFVYNKTNTLANTCIVENNNHYYHTTAQLQTTDVLNKTNNTQTKKYIANHNKDIYPLNKLPECISVLDKKNIINNGSIAGIIIHKFYLEEDKLNTNQFIINTTHLGTDRNISTNDFFYDKYYVKKIIATGFAFDSASIITAYHITNAISGGIPSMLENYCIVFGIDDIQSTNVVIPKEHVVYFDSVINSNNDTDFDFIQIKIKGKFPANIKLPKLSTNKETSNVYMIGYPLGTALHVSLHANTNKISSAYFTASLVGFEHSSGSPVFDSNTNELVGFLSGNYIEDVITKVDYNTIKNKIHGNNFNKKIIQINTIINHFS